MGDDRDHDRPRELLDELLPAVRQRLERVVAEEAGRRRRRLEEKRAAEERRAPVRVTRSNLAEFRIRQL